MRSQFRKFALNNRDVLQRIVSEEKLLYDAKMCENEDKNAISFENRNEAPHVIREHKNINVLSIL